VATGVPRAVDPVAQRLLRGLLELDVQREPHRVAGVSRDLRENGADRPAEGIDTQLRKPRSPAQVLVVVRLDAGLADRVAAAVTLVVQRLELLRRDLAHVAEHVRGELLVRVEAEVRRRDLDAREVLGTLLQIEDLRLTGTVLHLDRRQRIAAVLAHRGADLAGRDVQQPRELTDLAETNTTPLREVRAPDLDGGPRDVRDQHLAVPIEDRTARSLHTDVAALVVLSRAEQLLAVQDLE